MSVFFVDKKNIDCAVKLMHQHDPMGQPSLNVLGKRLWRMNYDAVIQRYGDIINKEERAAMRKQINAYIYDGSTMRIFSPIQLIKATACLSYQCSEGDVPNRRLYKKIAQAEREACADLVYASVEWGVAKWDLGE